jgi:hypothetical protein
LTTEDRQEFDPVVRKYAQVFHDEVSNDFTESNVVEHQILVGDANPIRRAPCRTPYALRKEMQTQVQNTLNKGIIRTSSSPWSVSTFLVPKKSQNGKPKFRFCVDFRALYTVPQFDSYPLPVSEETITTLYGSKYFTVLDCYSGFWQLGIKEEHKERTSFSVPSRHYEFNTLPFGLTISRGNFHRLMDAVLNDLVGTEFWVFINDIIVYSNPQKNTLRGWKMSHADLRKPICSCTKENVCLLNHRCNT